VSILYSVFRILYSVFCIPSVKNLPRYALFGLAIMAVSEVLMLLRIEPFWSWHTPMAWTGYILFVDGIVRARRGSSWLTSAPAEFTFLALVSIPLWLIFEFYNLFIRNWHYMNLPESEFWRNFGYAWSFATIWPAIFETAELVATLRDRRANDHYGRHRGHGAFLKSSSVTSATSVAIPAGGEDPPAAPLVAPPISAPAWASIVAGAMMLLWPLVWPSPYLAAPVWLGFIFLLDPLNGRANAETLFASCSYARNVRPKHVPSAHPSTGSGRAVEGPDTTGDAEAALSDWSGRARDRLMNLCVSGLMCGVVWEWWNYWAHAKWIYTVPILAEWKVFEMPLPGYLGFPPFALECFTMYVAARRWLWRGHVRPIGL